MDSTSNGEFAPIPLDPVARAARRAALEDATSAARRLGLSGRAYLVSACGAAATLATFDRVFAAAGHSGGRPLGPRTRREFIALRRWERAHG